MNVVGIFYPSIGRFRLLSRAIQPPDSGVEVGRVEQPAAVWKKEPCCLAIGRPVKQFRHVASRRGQESAIDKSEASLVCSEKQWGPSEIETELSIVERNSKGEFVLSLGSNGVV